MTKRRANGEGSIRKRPDGRWEGRYTAAYDPATGKRINKNVLGRTQAEVKEKLKQALAECDQLDVLKAGQYTVGGWLNRWYELYSKPYIREGTALYYKGFIDLHVIPAIGKVLLSKLTTEDIQQFYNDLLANGRLRTVQRATKPGLSNASVRGIHRMLHCALERAVKERLILRNPSDDCRIPKLEKREMKTLVPEQIGSYLHAAEERGVLPIFYLALTGGLRKGELVALRWDDLEVENHTVSISKQAIMRGGKLQIVKPKTATSIRKISLPERTVELLLEEHEKHPENPYLFPSPKTGEMYHPDSVSNLHKKILRDAGLEPIRLHDLRHTFATLALQSGVDVKTVSTMLGHYDAGFTLSTYAHATERAQEEAAEKLGTLLAQVM